MTVLTEANDLIYGDRNDTYGHPKLDFGRTGRLMGGILERWAKETQGEAPVPPELVALCLIAVKISRLCQTPDHRDSIVDIAGYAGCYDRVVTGE